MSRLSPQLVRKESQGITYWTDPALFEATGVRIAFTERAGGVSPAPYKSLNLSLHCGDDSENVWENRRRLLEALGIGPERLEFIASAHQTHSKNVAKATTESVGNRIIFDDIDAFVCGERDIPLLLCFADCTPVILVSKKSPYSVAVVHSGWKGTLLDVAGEALDSLLDAFKTEPKDIFAYIGPYVCAEHMTLPLSEGMKFFDKYETIAPANWESEKNKLNKQTLASPVKIDMEKAIRESLTKRGILPCNIVSLETCTAEQTDRFYSYRAEDGLTGRHGAFCMMTRVKD